MLRTELQVKNPLLRRGVQCLLLLALLATRSVGTAYAQPSAQPSPQPSNDATFLATLGQLRDASFDDKDNIVETIAQSGNPSAEAVLTALLEDRLYARNQDQMVVIAKPGEEGATTLDLID